MESFSHPSMSRKLFLSLGLLALAGCAHGGGDDFVSVAPPPSQGTRFSNSDLSGSWVGTLTPMVGPDAGDPFEDPYPFSMRFDPGGQPTSGADGHGRAWDAGSSIGTATVQKSGLFVASIQQNPGVRKIELTGGLNRSATVQTGTYQVLHSAVVVEEGSFEAELFRGPGGFDVAGQWSGSFFDRNGDVVPVVLELDADGTILGGEVTGFHTFIRGGPNTAVFVFSDPEVGRFDSLSWFSDDGSVQTLFLGLMSQDGGILSGTGNDSELGSGWMRLER